MEKAYKLEFAGEQTGSLYVNCCGLSRTEGLHSFGPALKPHYLVHYILSGKGRFSIGGKEYPLEAGYGFLITPDELAFYQADENDPWTYVWVGFSGTQAAEYISNIGLSVRQPVFKSEASEELYQIVKDMMEHNTFGLSNDLRRNGQLGVFLSIIAEGSKVDYLPLSDNAVSQLPARGDAEEAVFSLPAPTSVSYILSRWAAAASIDKHVTFHVARHTCATLLLTFGADLYTVSKLLGHSDVKTTQIYAKVVDEKKRAAVDLVPRV